MDSTMNRAYDDHPMAIADRCMASVSTRVNRTNNTFDSDLGWIQKIDISTRLPPENESGRSTRRRTADAVDVTTTTQGEGDHRRQIPLVTHIGSCDVFTDRIMHSNFGTDVTMITRKRTRIPCTIGDSASSSPVTATEPPIGDSDTATTTTENTYSTKKRKTKSTSRKSKQQQQQQTTSDGSKKPVRRRFMQTASALTTIDHIASTAEAIQMGMNPDDPDSKVPYIDSVTSKFLAYSYSIYHPERPPHPDFKDWPSYEKYLINLEYRSPDWHIEHSKFMSSSGAAAAAGIHPSRTPEKEFCTCRENKPEARSEFEYILFEIGIKMEPFHKMLYKLFNPTRCDIVECGSEIHPKYRWLLTTPDGKVHEFDEKTGTMVYKRRVEFKTPQRRGAFLEVPIEYMTQLQTNMQMDGTEDIDFPVLNLNQKTLETEYIILRAYRSDEYFAQLIERLKMFCRCVLANARPPPRDWDPPPVRTEMLFRITNVIPLIENGVDIVVQAITEAKKEARIKFIKDQERLRFEKQQEEIRRAYAMQDAQKALDSLDLL